MVRRINHTNACDFVDLNVNINQVAKFKRLYFWIVSIKGCEQNMTRLQNMCEPKKWNDQKRNLVQRDLTDIKCGETLFKPQKANLPTTLPNVHKKINKRWLKSPKMMIQRHKQEFDFERVMYTNLERWKKLKAESSKECFLILCRKENKNYVKFLFHILIKLWSEGNSLSLW